MKAGQPGRTMRGGVVHGTGARRLARAAALALLGLVGLAGIAGAELRRVEAIGTYGILESERRRVIPRDESIKNGTWEAVSRVATELIGDAMPFEEGGVVSDGEPERAVEERVMGPIDGTGSGRPARPVGEAEFSEAADPIELERLAELRGALGTDMLPYIRSYRILDDRGELPVLFAEQVGVDFEYVVLVEILVDEERVVAALEKAGLIQSAGDAVVAGWLELELVGLTRYAGLEAVLRLLRGPVGATRVEPLEFSVGRQLLAVEGPLGLEDLAVRLTELAGEGLVLAPLAVDPIRGRIRIQASWEPMEDAPAEVADPPPDTRGATSTLRR